MFLSFLGLFHLKSPVQGISQMLAYFVATSRTLQKYFEVTANMFADSLKETERKFACKLLLVASKRY